MKKRFEFFWDLAYKKTKIKHDLPPLLSRILCSSVVFVDDLFSVCFQERLRISFSLYFSLDICLFTYAFSCSLWRSSRRVLPILAPFLTFLRDFLDSLYAVYPLVSLVAVSFYPAYFHSKSSLHKLEFKQCPPFDKALALPVWLLCELIRNCKILRIAVQLKPRQFDYPLKTQVANYLFTQLHVKPSCNAWPFACSMLL